MNFFQLTRTFRLHKLLLCIYACLGSVCTGNAAEVIPENREYVLILNSYDESFTWSNSVFSPLIHEINTINNIDSHIEHLNFFMINYNDSEKVEEYSKNLHRKYGNIPPRVLVLLGNSATLFMNEINKFWKDVPIILCGACEYYYPIQSYIDSNTDIFQDRIKLSELKEEFNFTFMYSAPLLRENVLLMKQMIPEMKKLFFVSDEILPNRIFDSQLKEIIKKDFPDLTYQHVSTSTQSFNNLCDSLGICDKKSGILVSTWFSTVSASNVFLVDVSRSIANLYAPLFTLRYTGTENSGMVGGYMYNENNFTTRLLQSFREILNRKPAREIPFYYPTDGHPVLNYTTLINKGLKPEYCPKNTVFINKPVNFWKKYQWAIVGAFVIIVLIIIAQQRRIRILKELRKSQKNEMEGKHRYMNLIDNMPIIYAREEIIRNEKNEIVDVIIRDVNCFFEVCFWKREEVVGKKGSEVFPDTNLHFIHYITIALNEKRKVTFPYYFKRVDTSYDVVMNCSIENNCVDIFCIDITELQHAQQLLTSTNRKYSIALEVANIVPWKWDLEKQVITYEIKQSTTIASFMNINDSVTMRMSVQQFFSMISEEDYSSIKQTYDDLITGKIEKSKGEYRIRIGEQGLEWLEIQATIDHRDENGCPISLIGSSMLITERKKMETELRAAKERAEESNRLKSAFLANMSHEIRTPLNAIVGFSSIIASTETEIDKKEYTHIIENNSTLLLQLISDILDISKIEAGTLEFCYSNVELNTVIDELENVMKARAESKKLQLIANMPLASCYTYTERNRLMQVLNNLLTNALKFTEKGKVEFGYELQHENIYFYVTDTGCGIPEEKIDGIFGRFVKLNSFMQGSGLGLAICQTIVKSLGGNIGLESEEEKGSTFWFTIPYEPAQDCEKEKEEGSQPVIAVTNDKLTILIAEDNESNYILFESILKQDYHLLHACNGQKAVELYKEHQPQLILMDINMPVMNGYEATTEIRKSSETVPIIAVTAYAYAADEQKVMKSGFDGYLSKPVNALQLKQKISTILQERIIRV